MRNKKLKKAILTSFSIFAFTGTILAINLDNISNFQSGLSNEYSLNNEFKATNEEIDIVSNDVSTSNIESKATTTITLNSDSNSNSIMAGTYPFQLPNNRDVLSKIITINNTPPSFNHDRDVSYEVLDINNLNSSSIVGGRASINVSVKTYYDQNGTIITNGNPLLRSFIVTRFKSVLGQTSFSQIDSFDPVNVYASDVVFGTIPIGNVVGLRNNITNVSTSANTKVDIESLDFDNLEGLLIIKYTLTNYIDSSGNYINTKSPVFTLNVPNFIRVPGPTSLGLLDSINGSTLIPSTIAEQIKIDPQNYKVWFSLKNLPTTGAPGVIDSFDSIEANDKNGTISLTYTIIGDYFDNENVLRSTSTTGVKIQTTITGLNSELEKVDTIPIIIGASVGGIALIAAIALTIFFVSKAKKKKSENLRKQKLSEKVSPPSAGVSKTSTSPSVSGPTPSGPKPPVGPPTPGNRPVPPPAKK
ncbi:MAG: hypothetical protein ACRDCD_02850 [Mycoplasmoidaceae bacterium]